jgi:DNA-binding transcriptional LysR family regulator
MNMRTIELRQLRYFVILAKELHFGRAAELAFVTQPALSQQIAKLEEQVGAALFLRDRRQVQLTPAGRVFLDGVEKIFGELELSLRLARQTGNQATFELSVGMVEYTALPFIPTSLIRLQALYPDIKIARHEMNAARQIEALLQRQIDVGFGVPVVPLPQNGEVVSELILKSCWTLLIRDTHRLAPLHSIRLDDLASERLIIPARAVNEPLYDSVIARCRTAGFTPNVVYETMQAQVGITLVQQGLGVMLGAAYVFTSLPPGLRCIPIEGLDALPVHSFRRADENNGLVLDFIELAQEDARRFSLPPREMALNQQPGTPATASETGMTS